jgi:hypothetical protein
MVQFLGTGTSTKRKVINKVNDENAPTCDDGQNGAEERRFLELHRFSRVCLGGLGATIACSGLSFTSTPRSARAITVTTAMYHPTDPPG